ncbi:uncharacterized protein LOC128627200 [Artibeus jamaicensis]|uniref:uncharacterized protein LOC128627200 n=1 Tax=Artibeus jamaicensis TaxID=9417 RepID=UPI00235A689A|nr:uncharacterized protein LOC128627200 [Artibeus jamaicensis]
MSILKICEWRHSENRTDLLNVTLPTFRSLPVESGNGGGTSERLSSTPSRGVAPSHGHASEHPVSGLHRPQALLAPRFYSNQGASVGHSSQTRLSLVASLNKENIKYKRLEPETCRPKPRGREERLVSAGDRVFPARQGSGGHVRPPLRTSPPSHPGSRAGGARRGAEDAQETGKSQSTFYLSNPQTQLVFFMYPPPCRRIHPTSGIGVARGSVCAYSVPPLGCGFLKNRSLVSQNLGDGKDECYEDKIVSLCLQFCWDCKNSKGSPDSHKPQLAKNRHIQTLRMPAISPVSPPHHI